MNRREWIKTTTAGVAGLALPGAGCLNIPEPRAVYLPVGQVPAYGSLRWLPVARVWQINLGRDAADWMTILDPRVTAIRRIDAI